MSLKVISFYVIKNRYNRSMKKIFSTFLTLSCFVFILILPVFLWLHASMMPHHGMSAWDCIEHCISTETQIYSPKIISFSHNIEVFVWKIIFSKIFEYTVPLVLLYVILIHAPPNLFQRIQNYNYSSLIWVVKLTT